MHRTLLSVVLSLSVLLSTVVAAQESEYTFTPIDVPGATQETLPQGINNNGQIVGNFTDATGTHGFLKDDGTFITIDFPGAIITSTQGINDNGQVVGSFWDGTHNHGYLKDGDTFTTINVPGATDTLPTGINNNGQIVGYIFSTTGTKGFLKGGDTLTTFNAPGATGTIASGINNNGQIVGTFWDSTSNHGFLKDGDTFVIIDSPDASLLINVVGINDDGQIVGTFSEVFAPGNAHGFVKNGDTFTAIYAPGADDTVTLGINIEEQIVGWFRVGEENPHGFLAVPPEADETPPVVTVAASPATLSPPNGKMVTVTVSGTIMDEPNGSGVGSAAYTVTDEYGQVEPSGDVTPGLNGRYAFTVQLQASRNGNDPDGRRYTIEVSATDDAENESTKSAIVTVPRNK